jgi:hypothetical protein
VAESSESFNVAGPAGGTNAATLESFLLGHVIEDATTAPGLLLL